MIMHAITQYFAGALAAAQSFDPFSTILCWAFMVTAMYVLGRLLAKGSATGVAPMSSPATQLKPLHHQERDVLCKR